MIERRSVKDAATSERTADASGDPTDETEVVDAAAAATGAAAEPADPDQTAVRVPEATAGGEPKPEPEADPDQSAADQSGEDQPGEAEPEGAAIAPEPEGAETAAEPDGAETVAEPDATAQPESEVAVPDAAETAVRVPEAVPAVDPTAAAEDPEATLVREPAGPPSGPDAGEPVRAEARRPRHRARKVLLGVGIALVVLAGGYLAAASYFADKVPQGTTVAGVDISGLAADDAVETLQTQLADLVAEPIPVAAGERSATIDPAAAGLTFDAAATVDQVTGFTLDPAIVVGHILGVGELAPIVHVDDDSLTAAVSGASADLDVAPVDAAMAFADGDASVTTEPVDGLAIDQEASAALLSGQWLTGARPFTLPSEPVAPTLGDDAVETAMATIVDPLLSAPVTVQLNDEETTLSPEQLASAASLPADGSSFDLALDGEQLAEIVSDAVPSVGESPTDAKIVFEDGKPTVIPAVTGTGLDPEQLADVVATAAVATDEDQRVAVAELKDTEPDFSTEDAEALGVVEVVGEYSTPYPYDPTRTVNLINGAAHINGTLVMPGGTFSLIDALGPITSENGYVSSHVVENGFVTDAMGGGLSQMSTTTFNAAFESGMEDIFHKPHSRWFDRYPAGRESTMFAPSLDMKWGNNTPYGVLVQAWVDQSARRVHVRMWSTKYWDVDIVSGNKYNFTSPRTVYNQNATCTPESAGPSGFSIQVTRTVSLDGTVNDDYSRIYTWTYQPWNRVVCGAPPSDEDSDGSGD